MKAINLTADSAQEALDTKTKNAPLTGQRGIDISRKYLNGKSLIGYLWEKKSRP